jgi:hypothetical protein
LFAELPVESTTDETTVLLVHVCPKSALVLSDKHNAIKIALHISSPFVVGRRVAAVNSIRLRDASVLEVITRSPL